MLRRFRADLHVHTCLSPCGDLLMSPRKITARAAELTIALIAICDHNTAGNVAAVARAAGAGLTVLPGMEICTREEIHVLGIFESVDDALRMQTLIQNGLTGVNDPEVFGLQVVANEHDEVVGYEERLLIGATDVPVDAVVEDIHRLGGLAIASHIDRESYSVISQLGFIPESCRFDALELTTRTGAGEARQRFSTPPEVPFVRNSDAHFLEDIGSNTCEYLLDRPTFPELRKALRDEAGRRICDV